MVVLIISYFCCYPSIRVIRRKKNCLSLWFSKNVELLTSILFLITLQSFDNYTIFRLLFSDGKFHWINNINMPIKAHSERMNWIKLHLQNFENETITLNNSRGLKQSTKDKSVFFQIAEVKSKLWYEQNRRQTLSGWSTRSSTTEIKLKSGCAAHNCIDVVL